MKFRITFKTPDAVETAIYNEPLLHTNIEDDEEFELSDSDNIEDSIEEVREICKKFIKYGEYCTIEIDTDTEEAKVLPVK